MDNSTIFIPGNTPSLKNSKIKTLRGIFPSKTVKKYLTSFGIQHYSSSKQTVKLYSGKANLFMECFNQQFLDEIKTVDKPIKLGFHFVRNSRRKFDFNNANQIILDLLSAHNIIADDNMDEVIPIPIEIEGKYYRIDNEFPGVYIKIL